MRKVVNNFRSEAILLLIAGLLIIGTTVTLHSAEYHCEQYQGNIPADVSAQFQAGDKVYLGGYFLSSAAKEGVTYVTDNAAYQQRGIDENKAKRQTVSGVQKVYSVYHGNLDKIRNSYAGYGLNYDSVCASLGLDPNNPTAGGNSKASTTNNSAPAKKEISHGVYDAIDETAEKAFVDLLSEGDENNGYIQVKADTEDATIDSSTVNETKNKGRDGRVEFLTKDDKDKYDQLMYSVIFPQIEVENDVDLHAEFAELPDSQFDDMHTLGFKKQELGAEVVVKLHYGEAADTTVYVLTGTGDDNYNTLSVQQTDENGDITFKTATLDNFVVTTTDVVSVREAIAKAEKEEQARVEAERKAKEEEKATEEAKRIEEEEKQHAEEDRLAAEAAEQERLAVEKKRTTTGIAIGVVAAILAVCATVIIATKKKKK